MDISNFKLNEEGLQHFFGSLETTVMEILWSMPSNEATIKEVNTRINTQQELSFNTIMTVMNRLTEKGHLIKKSMGKKGALYRTKYTRDEFVNKQTGTVTQVLFKDFGDYAVNHMINALEEVDADVLTKLENKLKEIRSRRES
jgi:predicted transcriptional regulator